MSQELGTGIFVILGLIIAFPLAVTGLFLTILYLVIPTRFKWIQWLLTTAGGLTFIVLLLREPLTYLSFLDILENKPVQWLEKSLQTTFTFTGYSLALYIAGGLIIAQGLAFYFLYVRSKLVNSKQAEQRKYEESALFKKIRKNRIKLNQKVQAKIRYKKDFEKIVLGIDDKGQMYAIDKNEPNQHVLITGTTGAGKTVVLLSFIEYALQTNCPVIFIDGKGQQQTVDEVQKLYDHYNKKLHVFSDTTETYYNPIKHGNRTEIMDRMTQVFDWSEIYYKTKSKDTLHNLVWFIDEYGFSRDLFKIRELMNRKKVLEILDNDYVEIEEEHEEPVPIETDSIDKLPDEVIGDSMDDLLDFPSPSNDEKPKNELKAKTRVVKKKRKVPSERSKHFRQLLFEDFDGDEDAFTGIEILRQQLSTLLNMEFGHLFHDKEGGIDLVEIANKGEGVLFTLSGNKYRDSLQKFARLVTLDVNHLVTRRSKENDPVYVFLDEFGRFANEETIDVVSLSRSANFRGFIATQTLGDIEKVEPGFADRIIGNTNTYFVGLSNDEFTVQKFANTFGTYDDIDITYQIEKWGGDINRLDRKADMGTVRNVKVYDVDPDKFRNNTNGVFAVKRKAVSEVERAKIVYMRYPLDFSTWEEVSKWQRVKKRIQAFRKKSS